MPQVWQLLEHLLTNDLMKKIEKKEALFRKHLTHPKIKEIRGCGLMLALEFDDEALANNLVEKALEKA